MIKKYIKYNDELLNSYLEIAKSYGADQTQFIAIRKYIVAEVTSLNSSNPYFIKFCEKTKKVEGIVQLKTEDHKIRSHIQLNSSLAHIHGMQVKKALQRNGIGSSIIKFVFNYALENNIEYLTLCVEIDNDKAISFYKKNGFKSDNVFYRKGILIMVKKLVSIQ